MLLLYRHIAIMPNVTETLQAPDLEQPGCGYGLICPEASTCANEGRPTAGHFRETKENTGQAMDVYVVTCEVPLSEGEERTMVFAYAFSVNGLSAELLKSAATRAGCSVKVLNE